MGSGPILPTKVHITIDTMFNFNIKFDRHGDITCKQNINVMSVSLMTVRTHQLISQ